MKNLPCLFLLILLAGCTHPSKKEKDISKTNIILKDSIQPGDKDSVLIDDDNYKLTRGELRKILKENPELNNTKLPLHPDITYFGKIGKSMNNFNSEVGQDDYYVLYAYFLKLKNGEKKYKEQRQTLIKIYQDINSIYWKLARGGTYFGHQYSRIPGYAEYSIYQAKDNDYYIKTYNISKQKTLYLSSLRQIIIDELSTDFDFLENEKPALKKELFKTVNELDSLITNYFYLENARAFQYEHY